MADETAYASIPWTLPEIEHGYGDRVHLLADPVALTLLAQLGNGHCTQPAFNRILERLYERLFAAAANALLPRKPVRVPTRMEASEPGAAYVGEAIDRNAKVVLVGVARAGTLPAYQGAAFFNELLDPAGVRIDHVTMERRTDADGKVVGVDHSGSKFGGGVDQALVVVPDPMGATGGSMSDAVDLIGVLPGRARAIATLHLIITPEFIARMQRDHPGVHVFALRLDRGLSTPEALASTPGTTEGERGCNDIHYIVPGAGGLGELINNSFV